MSGSMGQDVELKCPCLSKERGRVDGVECGCECGQYL
jgi:hypothetical protein